MYILTTSMVLYCIAILSYTHAATQKSMSPPSSQSVHVYDVPVTVSDPEDTDMMDLTCHSCTVYSSPQGHDLIGPSCTVSPNPSVAPVCSGYRPNQTQSQPVEICLMKDELEKLLEHHYEDMVDLAASLTKLRKDTLHSMPSKNLVDVLFDAIENDCNKEYGVQICLKHLYIYLYKKGHRTLALDSLKCTEESCIG